MLSCSNGLPCIYTTRDTWVPYEDVSKSKPPQPKSSSWKDGNTKLFISIASFRDKLCPKTLFNAFTKAAFPGRITIGVVQQNEPGDIDCMEEYCKLIKNYNQTDVCLFKDKILIMKKDAKKSMVCELHVCNVFRSRRFLQVMSAGTHLGKSVGVDNDSGRRVLHADGLTYGLRLELGH